MTNASDDPVGDPPRDKRDTIITALAIALVVVVVATVATALIASASAKDSAKSAKDAVSIVTARNLILETLEEQNDHSQCVDDLETNYELALGQLIIGSQAGDGLPEGLFPDFEKAVEDLKRVQELCPEVDVQIPPSTSTTEVD